MNILASSSKRASALVLAFGVVAGGAAVSAPVMASAAPIVAPMDAVKPAFNPSSITVSQANQGTTVAMTSSGWAADEKVSVNVNYSDSSVKTFDVTADANGDISYDLTIAYPVEEAPLAAPTTLNVSMIGATSGTVIGQLPVVADATPTAPVPMTPVAWAEKDVYTVAEFQDSNAGVNYKVLDFAPNTQLTVTGKVGDMEFTVDPDSAAVTDDKGAYSGNIYQSAGDVTEGYYTFTVSDGKGGGASFVVYIGSKPAPSAAIAKDTYEVSDLLTNGMDFSVKDFPWQTQLKLWVVAADGTVTELPPADPGMFTDDMGVYAGHLTFEGNGWVPGQYTLMIGQDGETEALAQVPFTIVADSVASQDDEGLANTGADVFGPAGLALVTLAAGAGVLAVRRIRRA